MDPATIALIGAGLKAAIELGQYIAKVRERLLQNGEWTAEQEQAFQNHVASVTSQPHWQPSTPPTNPT